MGQRKKLTRRDLLKNSAVAAGTLALAGPVGNWAYAQGSDTIRVGVIGCGGRGTGAAHDCFNSSKGVEIVALADAFGDRLGGLKNHFKVPDNRCFTGLDGYKQLLALDDINMVILATPPGFRPQQLKAAVDAGKNIFMEKPVATCPAGIKMVLEASAKAREKGLAIVCGTQRRHEPRYVETMKRIHDGAIGEIVSAQCYWNQGGLWNHARKPEWTDMEWQCRNWLYFTWLSGDHICEQHVHNIDVINWAFKDAAGAGSRPGRAPVADRTGVRQHFRSFRRGVFLSGRRPTISMCRQIDGTTTNVSERVVGTRGPATAGRIDGENAWRYEGPNPNPYVEEHKNLIASIRSGEPLNEGERIANSTLCAIMGRESAYARQQFKRDWFLARCTLNYLPPEDMKLGDSHEVGPVPVPGKYKLPTA